MKRAVLIFLSIIAIVLLLWGVDRAIAAPYPTGVGGTGTGASPAAGQVLVGTGSSTYTPSYLLCSGNCSVSSASGTVTVNVPPQSSSTITIYPVSAATSSFSIVGDGSYITVTNPATSTIKVSLSTAQVLQLLSATSPLSYNSSTGQFSCASCLTSLNGALLVANNLSDVASTTASRNNLGLGSIATYSKTDYLTSSTVYVGSVNGISGAVTITSSSLGVVPFATTSINGTSALSFHIVGDGATITSTVSGATTSFSLINTGNWAGTWQGNSSSTFLSTSTAGTTYVPYTGATGNVTLGSNSLTAASGTFTGTLNVTTPTGSIATFGTNVNNATTSPVEVSFGGTIGTAVPGNQSDCKWDLYNANIAGTKYCIAMSASLMQFIAGGLGAFSFFPADQNSTSSNYSGFYLNTTGAGFGNDTNPLTHLEAYASDTAAGTPGTEPILNLVRPITATVSYPQAATFNVGTYCTNSSGNNYGPCTELDIDLQNQQANTDISTNTVEDLHSDGNVLFPGKIGVGTAATSTATVNDAGTIKVADPTGLAGAYLATSTGGFLTVSSTIASSSVSFILTNPTTTTPYNLTSVYTGTKKTIVNVDCWEAASGATTTIELFYNTTLASTSAQQIILASLACTSAGESTTTFTTSTLPINSYLFADVSSTAGTPEQTTVDVSATKL